MLYECKKCNKIFSNEKYCPICGSPLVEIIPCVTEEELQEIIKKLEGRFYKLQREGKIAIIITEQFKDKYFGLGWFPRCATWPIKEEHVFHII